MNIRRYGARAMRLVAWYVFAWFVVGLVIGTVTSLAKMAGVS